MCRVMARVRLAKFLPGRTVSQPERARMMHSAHHSAASARWGQSRADRCRVGSESGREVGVGVRVAPTALHWGQSRLSKTRMISRAGFSRVSRMKKLQKLAPLRRDEMPRARRKCSASLTRSLRGSTVRLQRFIRADQSFDCIRVGDSDPKAPLGRDSDPNQRGPQ